MMDMTSTPLSFIKSADIQKYAWKKGTKPVEGVWPIKAPHSTDLLFIDDEPISCALPGGEEFTGTAGVIRHLDNGSTQLAIFQGSRIATKDFAIEVPGVDETGVSATFVDSAEISGEFFSPHGASSITLQLTDPSHAAQSTFYIDGEKQSSQIAEGKLILPLPAGHHDWQYTARRPRPLPAQVTNTEDFPGGAQVFFNPVTSADSYQLQESTDSGATWKSVTAASASPIRIAGSARSKIHVRLVASNADASAAPGDAYPVYFTDHPPDAPDGLYLHVSTNRVEPSWGQILGCGEYRLYRRRQGEGNPWTCIYDGPSQTFVDDSAAGVVPANDLPGVEHSSSSPVSIYEYAVSAVNGIGESPKSALASTDPAGWGVWWPKGQSEQFKRQSAYWLPPYVSENQSPPARYPTND
jgi:hypothetical protein